MRVRHQHEVDLRQIVQLDAGMLDPLDDLQPFRPVRIDQDIDPLRLEQKRGMPDPGQADLPFRGGKSASRWVPSRFVKSEGISTCVRKLRRCHPLLGFNPTFRDSAFSNSSRCSPKPSATVDFRFTALRFLTKGLATAKGCERPPVCPDFSPRATNLNAERGIRGQQWPLDHDEAGVAQNSAPDPRAPRCGRRCGEVRRDPGKHRRPSRVEGCARRLPLRRARGRAGP